MKTLIFLACLLSACGSQETQEHQDCSIPSVTDASTEDACVHVQATLNDCNCTCGDVCRQVNPDTVACVAP